MSPHKLHDTSYLPVNFIGNPPNVKACTTLITGGFSTDEFSEYNLAMHVDDDDLAVKKNRAKLIEDLALPAGPVWLDQIHSDKVVTLNEKNVFNAADNVVLQADASVSTTKGVVCAVLTADCLPVFFCNYLGTEVAIAHAGWRGLHAGIISKTLNAMNSAVDTVSVNLGPAIGPAAFQVGVEVRQSFVEKSALNAQAFVKTSNTHYLCDIYMLARIELRAFGVKQVSGGGYCTYSEQERFYSYRRQPKTGRMASLIWIG